jgi:hypothetical protein
MFIILGLCHFGVRAYGILERQQEHLWPESTTRLRRSPVQDVGSKNGGCV